MNKRTISLVLVVAIMVLAFAPMADASSNRLLRLGSRGSDVRTLQQRLNSLGYNCGSVDGIFGSRTLNAVRNFQRKNGLAVDGIVGPATRSKLFGSTPSRGGTSSSSSGSSSSSKAPITGLLRRGSRGSQVSTLQSRLNQLGYNCGKVDGIFGSATYNAVVRFQRANKLAVDGIVGPATIAKLYPSGSGSSGSSSKPKPPAKPDPKPEKPQHKPPAHNVPLSGLIRMGDRGSQVTILQKRLNELGYNCGKADGIFGTLTYNAVVRFQRDKGLAVDGIVGPATIAALYPPKHDPGLNDFVEYEVKKGSLNGTTVVIDAGHGGTDSGASRNGYHEKTFTLDLAKRLERMLKKAGAEVIMTRSSDVYVELKDRANKVNEKVLDEEIKGIEAEITEITKDIESLNKAIEESANEITNLEDEIKGLKATITDGIKSLSAIKDFKGLAEPELPKDLNMTENIIKEKLQELQQEPSKVESHDMQGVQEDNVDEDLEVIEASEDEPNDDVEQDQNELLEQLNQLIEDIETMQEKQNQLAEKQEEDGKLEDSKSLQERLEELQSELQILKKRKSKLGSLAGGSRQAKVNDEFKYVLDRSDKYSNIIFISIHNNSTGATSQTSASGIRVYYRPTMKVKDESGKSVVYYDGYNDDGRKLFAQILNEEMQKKSVFSKKTNKLYNDSDLAVLREQNVVSALVEVGFINNPNDLALLRRQQTREDIAAGMFEGIRKYFAQIKNKVKNLLGA